MNLYTEKVILMKLKMSFYKASKIEGEYRHRKNKINGIIELRKSMLTFIRLFLIYHYK